jgi:hypothetical protein
MVREARAAGKGGIYLCFFVFIGVFLFWGLGCANNQGFNLP